MTEEIFEKSKYNFKFLMSCIDEYTSIKVSTSRGQLYFLKESELAQRVISKYGGGNVKAFKAFFCREVLELHRGKKEGAKPLSIKSYEDYFNGQSTKKNKFRPEFMNRCMENNDLLLDRLKEYTYEALKEYFLLSNCEEKDGAKEKIYSRFIMLACLYEIFVMKFFGGNPLEQAVEAFREVQDFMVVLCGKIDALSDKAEKSKQVCKMTEEEKKSLGAECLGSMQKVAEDTTQLAGLLERGMGKVEQAVRYIAHCKQLTVFAAIITMIEFENINMGGEVPMKIKREEMSDALFDMLPEEYEYLFMENVSMNKNLTELYAAYLESAEQEQMLRELCSRPKETIDSVLKLLRQYFHMVQKGEYAESEFLDVVHKIALKCL